MFELHHLTANEQLDGVRRGDWTPGELTAHYLERIGRLDPEIGAFVEVTADRALERAASLQSASSPVSRASALWALPFADKDLVARAGVPTRFGSRAMADVVPEASDEIALAFDAAGAVSLGKTATPEFGLSGYTEPLAGRPVRNPYDLALGVGGSSGGAAAAVAAGLLPFAPGSDGGGSIRIPAAATGLVGLKPSRGRIPSAAGFASLGGLVTHGPLARTVADAALVLDALVGAAPYRHATAAPSWDQGAFLNAAVRGEGRFQVGVTADSPWATEFEVGLQPEARAALAFATAELAALGHGVEEFGLEPEPDYPRMFLRLWQAAAAGIPLEGDAVGLTENLTRWLIARGRELSARQLGEALQFAVAFERRLITQLAGYDAVLTPVLAVVPPELGWYDAADAERNFAQQVRVSPFTSMVNVAGLPALALPVHRTAAGIPMGVQLIGRPGGEDVLLAIGAQLERRLGWHRVHPPQW